MKKSYRKTPAKEYHGHAVRAVNSLRTGVLMLSIDKNSRTMVVLKKERASATLLFILLYIMDLIPAAIISFCGGDTIVFKNKAFQTLYPNTLPCRYAVNLYNLRRYIVSCVLYLSHNHYNNMPPKLYPKHFCHFC